MSGHLRSLALAGLAAWLVVSGCSDSDDDSTATTSTAGASTTAETGDTADEGGPSAAPDDTLEVVIEGGDVVEGAGRHAVDLGETVRISITGDVADEVHVHGYDVLIEIEPGDPTMLEFTADIPGIFEVELEEAHQLLFELQVQ